MAEAAKTVYDNYIYLGQLRYYKSGQPLLQNRAAIANWSKMYYKLGQVLQIRAITTNWGITITTYYSKKTKHEDSLMFYF